MIENKKNNKSSGNRLPNQIKNESKKEEDILDYNNINNKKIESSNDNFKNKIKETPQVLKNSFTLSNEETKNREADKRYDLFGNLIKHGGKQKISFIDRISKNNFVEVIKIDNYKEYNKMEEIKTNKENGCCLLI